MAGPQDIQRYPKGLIDLLGMRATGETPHTLGQDIRGSLELLDLYVIDRCVEISGSTGIAVPGVGVQTFASGTVPAGELWLLYQVSFTMPTVAAAATIRSAFGVQRSQSTCITLQDCTTPLLAAADAIDLGHTFERPLVMRPGDGLACKTIVFTGAPAVTPTHRSFVAKLLI